ncbi:preprotein translocase subunit SecA [Candidatus Magnetoovum chiemensis]|nr:preprotein translocase subunit SecA [Candidatus Magnetoovum chiemensis]
MFSKALKIIFGTRNEREIKRIRQKVEDIQNKQEEYRKLTDDELKNKTTEFKTRLDNGETLDDILSNAFAAVRETSNRTLNMFHFEVQLIGGIVLHEGKIAEMKTGEGKTLVATLPVYLNALEGKGVHVVTVNDYLAKRDAQWMGPIYSFLGLSVGVIQHSGSFLFSPHYRSDISGLDFLKPCSRHEAYRADITYGTNNEYGFDYLRDNMKYELADYCQRELNFAIVDEVDSILIDESRTPLIISGPSEESTDKYYKINRIIPNLKVEEDFTIDEKAKNVVLTENGAERAEKMLGVENLFDPINIELVHHVLQGLKAHHLYKIDVDYVIKDGEIIIVDEFTGRLMPGRRWSDGLHQAIEAKEAVKIANENQTLASVTFQNFFRMYKKLAGMTGTADTEAAEFNKIYNLEVLVVPTNKEMKRTDHPDLIYKTEKAKFNAAINEITECYEKGQPVLVGTISIEKSELLSRELKKKGIPHSVLNAKYHDKEAEIIAQAGRKNAITIATNMAGRGTDIILGGNPKGIALNMLKDRNDYTDEELAQCLTQAQQQCAIEKQEVLEAGGLHILGTERHEARRIDNQLRGRSGRQGDPGSSRFYLSLEDDLMRIFGSDKISSLMGRLGMEEDMPIENRLVTRAIENAQRKVEAHNFDIRKHLLEYDDVMNRQRNEIYSYRLDILRSNWIKDLIFEMIEDVVDDEIERNCPENTYFENFTFDNIFDALFGIFGIPQEHFKHKLETMQNLAELKETILTDICTVYKEKQSMLTEDAARYMERILLLQIVDFQWKDHLLNMDHLKEGIGLRGYGQKDPLVEYKKEGFETFNELGYRITTEFLTRLFHIQVTSDEQKDRIIYHRARPVFYNRSDDSVSATVKKGKKVGRNDPCPCGSGKKYKKCCLSNA